MQCDSAVDWIDLQWRDGAVMARDMIELIGIHRREALPTGAFLSGLEQATGTAWRYLFE